MQLPFRYQFLLAPATIILMLAGLVAYLLIELPQIHRENEVTRQWELVTDRALVAVATAARLDQLAQGMAGSPAKRDELLFDYIEQTRIYLDNSQNPELLARATEDVRRTIKESETQLRDPERVDPRAAHATLSALLPALEQLSIDFQSQKRIAYMDYHGKLRVIVSRLMNAALTVLMLCIAVGIGLAAWGLLATRRRLHALTQRANRVCAGEFAPLPAPPPMNDELGRLDACLATMTRRLIDVVAVEKVLQGTEDERRRIAMDMHDGVLADLTALSRTLDRAESAGTSTPPVTELRANVDELADSIRRVIDDLHPQSLEILGLEAALRSFLDRHGGVPGYHFEFDPGVETALQPAQKIHLFRITTEAIHNVIRHARCSRYEVSVRLVVQRLLATVEDNGIGMPPDAHAQGHGCLNIAERARIIGAQASWSASRFSSGTRFELSLPLGVAPCPA